MLCIERGEKARPAGAGFKLGCGVEQRQRAQFAQVAAILLVVEQATAKRMLGAVIEQDVAFRGTELLRQALAFVRIDRGDVVTAGRCAHAGDFFSLSANLRRSLATLGRATAAM